jgi:hypothetical protein
MTIKIKIERDGETFWECEVPTQTPEHEDAKLTKVIEALNELLIERLPSAEQAIQELMTGRRA